MNGDRENVRAHVRMYTRDIWITRCVKSRLHEVEKIVFYRGNKRGRYNAPWRDIDTIGNPNAYDQLSSEEIFFPSLSLICPRLKSVIKLNEWHLTADNFFYSLILTRAFVTKVCRNLMEVRNDFVKFQSNTLER